MSNATPNFIPKADRWQRFQTQLSRTTPTDSGPRTRRSWHGWRALPVPVSATAAIAEGARHDQ
jgi:hypothetical protein